MDSILDSTKSSLGVLITDDAFEIELKIAINSALMSLNQLGIGPAEPLVITGSDETWEDLLGTSTNLESAKAYILLKTKLMFDPPANSYAFDAIERQLKEIEFRLQGQIETGGTG